ncbi:MAG: MFS transporter [Lewinella sp.]
MPPSTTNILDSNKLSSLQYATVFICFLMNILDGMDVLVISYCAPAIASAWNVGPEALGVVFSAGLAGMAVGALFLAPFADHIGRKKMILLSAFIVGGGIFLTSFCSSVSQLVLLRFLSGLGIGAMLASTASLTAEYTPDRTKDFWVSFVLSGYPVGAVLSGLVAARVVPESGWSTMFQLAGLMSFITIPLIWFFLSESVDFYLRKQPVGALEKVNRIMGKMNREHLRELPPKPAAKTTLPVGELMGPVYRLPTLKLWAALFLSFAALYFLVSWIPKLATNAGLSLSLAIYAGTVFNLGSFLGIITQGYFSSRYGLKRTISLFFILTAILMAVFRLFIGSDALLVLLGLLGFGIQGGFVGLYAVAARLYPTDFRTMGVGWSIGIGRLGAVIGPALGGVLIGAGVTMAGSFMIFAVPTLLAGVMTILISSKKVS